MEFYKLKIKLNKLDFDTVFLLFKSLNLDEDNPLFIYRDLDQFCDENFPNSPSMAVRAACLGNLNLTDDFLALMNMGI